MIDQVAKIEPSYWLLAWIGLMMLCAVIVVCLLMTKATMTVFSQGSPESHKAFCLMLERANALQMSAVILIVVGACALRIMEEINAESVVSILSGVAGYVLGQSSSNSSTSRQVPQDRAEADAS